MAGGGASVGVRAGERLRDAACRRQETMRMANTRVADESIESRFTRAGAPPQAGKSTPLFEEQRCDSHDTPGCYMPTALLPRRHRAHNCERESRHAGIRTAWDGGSELKGQPS